MRFSEVMSTLHRDGEGWSAEVGEDWLQGRSVFGGMQVALVARAMRSTLGAGLPLRTIQATFLAPQPAGALRIAVASLRSGKNTEQVEGRLLDQAGQTLCLVIGVFGQARSSVVAVEPSQPPLGPDAVALKLPFIAGLTPSFMQHFEARWRRGDLPFSGGRKTCAMVDVSLRDEGVLDEAALIAYADFMPPLALSHLSAPAAGSSLTWLLELFGEVAQLPAQGWRIDATLEAAHDGYTSQTTQIWGPHGKLLALGRQSMLVFG